MSVRLFTAAFLFLGILVSRAAITVTIERNDSAAMPPFKFKTVPFPSSNDAGTAANFTVISGSANPNGGGAACLHDGKVPDEEDEPERNFFFSDSTDGGQILVDLQNSISIQQINTYSWHPNSRAPQVYQLFGSAGQAENFTSKPPRQSHLEGQDWTRIASIDTRETNGLAGGQYGVSITDSGRVIGSYRYLLFVISRTEDHDGFGNTFYGEMDIVDKNAKNPALPVETIPLALDARQNFAAAGGQCTIIIDATRAGDLKNWAFKDLAPVAQQWYPKIAALLPSAGFTAPAKLTIDMGKGAARYAAITRGAHITCNPDWARKNLHGEATGCVVHEMVHVVQHYGDAKVRGWLTEGIADYIRWYIYEPQSHGADLDRKAAAKARYDASYRVTANFLDWVTTHYDKNIVRELNAALRNHVYSTNIWAEHTGHTVEQLGDEWKQSLLAPQP